MVRMTAAKRRFSAHLFKAEKLCWCNVLEASLPQSVLTHSQFPSAVAGCKQHATSRCESYGFQHRAAETLQAGSSVRTIRWSQENDEP